MSHGKAQYIGIPHHFSSVAEKTCHIFCDIGVNSPPEKALVLLDMLQGYLLWVA